MSGILTQFAVRALDRAARALGRGRGEPAHLATGRRGEELAYFHLRKLGYIIVARNWRSPRHRGEIDLIGWDGEALCFVEVKTRSTREVKAAEAAVDVEKQRDLAAVAGDYLRRLKARPAVVRCDVVSVYTDEAPPQITVFRDAFRLT